MKLVPALGLIAALTVSAAQACEHGTLKEYVDKARSARLIVMDIPGDAELRRAIDYVNAVSARNISGDYAVLIVGQRGALLVISLNGCVVGGAPLNKGGEA